MKKLILIACVMTALGLSAQVQTRDVTDIESDDVQLEMITSDQPVKESKKEKKEREKRLREFNDDIAYAKASNSMRRGYFVFLVNEVVRGGNRHTGLNENTNFLLVQDNDGIIQVAFNTYRPGANGLGGWTDKGTVRDKRIKYDDNGDVHVEYQLVSNKQIAYVYITLYHNSNRAVANISGAVKFTAYGEIRPYRDKDHR